MTDEQFEKEVGHLRPKLISIAGSILGNCDEAEDAVQDVLVKLWNRRSAIDMPMKSLAVAATRNCAIDKLRRREARHEQALTPATDVAQSDTCDARAERMNAAVATLPEVWQNVMRLRMVEGAEYEKIARLIGTSEQNVRQILSRARKAVLLIYSQR